MIFFAVVFIHFLYSLFKFQYVLVRVYIDDIHRRKYKGSFRNEHTLLTNMGKSL